MLEPPPLPDAVQQALRALSTDVQELNSTFVTELAALPTPLEFMRYVARNRPFVVRGGAQDWPARTKWTMAYLCERLRDQLVTVAVTPNGYADAVVDDTYFVEPYQTRLPFREIVDLFEQRSRRSDQSTPGPASAHLQDYHYYVQSQNGNLAGDFQVLEADVLADIPFATAALETRPDAVNFWMGQASSVTSLHKDPYENIYVVLAGTKTFTLLAFSLTCLELRPRADGSTVPWVAVDPLDRTSAARARYPLFYNEARALHVTVASGDLFYLPALWYHHVQQSDDDAGRVIAVNYWYDLDYTMPLYPYFRLTQNLRAAVPESELDCEADPGPVPPRADR
ncbi:hypothetical protein IWQ60_002968 [Tieghemiomyces parasiticus]|uniref:JmjC domain-containing protein n=1 Tax=Tieghemiomyces parasiticus TaxID=78921 RepID=A0A9W8AI81_9FUNG|nr:hypothetical protein IWQ60_002968 [Tieghemiomyces parasiticus]